MDLLSVLPGFSTHGFIHIIPPLERRRVTVVDLITLDPLEIARRARVPPADVRRLTNRIVEALHEDIGVEKSLPATDALDSTPNPNKNHETPGREPATEPQWNTISTLDPAMDALLGGGIPTGYVTELTGESGSGKTQFLLSLCLAVQLPKPQGLQQRAIYISTEHPLSTPRLTQLLESHPAMSTLPPEQAPSLEDILSINAMDLETQDHILFFQLPVAIERYDIGLVIIDSITSNYRAEHSTSLASLANRGRQLAKTGNFLRKLAIDQNVAIVVANQVSDRFEPIGGASLPRPPFTSRLSSTQGQGNGPLSQYPRSRTEQIAAENSTPSSTAPRSSQISPSPYHAPEDKHFDGSYLVPSPERSPFLSLAYQGRFFSGWGDGPNPDSGSLKNPALGFFWSTQVPCRIALKKEGLRAAAAVDGDDTVTPYPTRADVSRDPDSIAMPAPPPPRNVVPGPQSQSLALGPEPVTRRVMKLVYCPWAGGLESALGEPPSSQMTTELEFEIWKGGLRATSHVG
ncbi:unnamed protein product [Penicillium salamii]|nr:unnamed protein product [Penicillium salamii]CAG8234870.1 unnamed protein product [Penicillium salamii]